MTKSYKVLKFTFCLYLLLFHAVYKTSLVKVSHFLSIAKSCKTYLYMYNSAFFPGCNYLVNTLGYNSSYNMISYETSIELESCPRLVQYSRTHAFIDKSIAGA